MKNTTTILHIDCSPSLSPDISATRALTQTIVQGLRKRHPESKVIVRDLARDPLPHISFDETRNPYQYDLDPAIDELFKADFIVIGVPMHNFSIPSSLKAWIDLVVRSGKTFQFDASSGQPAGLLGGDKQRRVYLALASGGIYSTGAMQTCDFAEPYLRHILGFIGLTDIHTVRAEGLAVSATKDVAVAEAQMRVTSLLSQGTSSETNCTTAPSL